MSQGAPDKEERKSLFERLKEARLKEEEAYFGQTSLSARVSRMQEKDAEWANAIQEKRREAKQRAALDDAAALREFRVLKRKAQETSEPAPESHTRKVALVGYTSDDDENPPNTDEAKVTQHAPRGSDRNTSSAPQESTKEAGRIGHSDTPRTRRGHEKSRARGA